MNSSGSGAARFIITVALLAIAAGFWFLQTYGTARPVLAPLDASPHVFSAARAERVLARILGPEKSHPVSSDENARVRARIVNELTRLGLHPSVQRAFACHLPRASGVLICASVNNVIAAVRPGAGRAIVLLAHYDSVPAGPGAADDESGVATVIETARALIARGLANRHPILAVLTDGEETGLLGAVAFLHDPAMKTRVGAVINVEARGNRGPSLLFQTSPGDGPLIDLYAHSVTDYATSSLYHEIYRFLPNDTDMTLFIADGYPSFNFAYVGGVADYHTAHDTRTHLDSVSLQQQGDNMLGVAGALERADLTKLGGDDEIYLDILGRWLPHVPASWALPLAIAAMLLLGAAVLLARSEAFLPLQRLCAAAGTPALIVLGVGSGFVLHAVAALVSGMPDPSYAYPTALRIALALALGGATLLVSRFAPARALAPAAWLWLAGLGLVVAIFLPGLSPYFLIPTLAAGIPLIIAARAPGGWDGPAGTFGLLISALAALLVWSAIGSSGEILMGLRLHPLFTVPFVIGLSTLVPLLARYRLPRGIWIAATAALFGAAIGAAVVQGLEPAFSSTAAQRLNITYIEDRHRAWWALDASAPVPPPMRAVEPFSSKPTRLPGLMPLSYLAPAGPPRFTLPTAKVVWNARPSGTRYVTLDLHGSGNAAQMFLQIPGSAELKALDLGGWHFDAPPEWVNEDSVALACMSRDCANMSVTLTLGTDSAVTFTLYEHRFGLPDFARRLIAARPVTTVQSQNGDGVTLIGEVHAPAVRK